MSFKYETEILNILSDLNYLTTPPGLGDNNLCVYEWTLKHVLLGLKLVPIRMKKCLHSLIYYVLVMTKYYYLLIIIYGR